MNTETTPATAPKPTVAAAPKINIAKNSFAKSLAEVRRGGLLTECSEALSEVTKAVMETGKAGSMTITLKVRRNADGESVEVIAPYVNKKVPRKDPQSTNFYVGEDGELLRDHPKQQEMFNVVEPEAAAPIELKQPSAMPLAMPKPGEGGEVVQLRAVNQ